MRTIPAELVERYEAAGWWRPETIGDVLRRGLDAAPDAAFRIHSTVRPWSGTFADVDRVARRLAAGLRARGVGPGDVVVFQLPNWMEAAAVFWAASFLGATVVPVVHFYGRKELSYILGAVRPKVFVTAERFGRMEHQPDLSADVPIVGVVGRDFDDLLADEPMAGVLAADPGGPALIAFTSGTTSDPKGVVHSHRTLAHESRQRVESVPAGRGPMVTAFPVGHFMGMLSAFLVPVLEGTPINLVDVWDPALVLRLMAEDGLAVGGGTPYHVTSLLDHPDFTPAHLAHMRYLGMGGAPIPAEVAGRFAELGLSVIRSYGSTEHPSVTGAAHTDPAEKRLHTDGVADPGVEIRLTDEGEILTRGPDLCLGYTDPALTARAFDAEGWYHTGDIGTLDDDGYLTITDRKADVIIRGGENISAAEVEDVLLGMPGVTEVAVVAAPDERLGEHAAAVLRMRPGQAMPTKDEVRAHFERTGVARQKWPEELHEVSDFPRTATGKVQKYLVRQNLAEERTASPPPRPTARRNWGRWGDDDERGALNLLTDDVVRAAAASITRGRVYSLGIPIQGQGVPLMPHRGTPMRLTLKDGTDDGIYAARGCHVGTGSHEDVLVMASHTTTHMDALVHVYGEYQHYNGVGYDTMQALGGARRLGIDKVGGFAARAVLLDMVRYFGAEEHLEPGHSIGGADLAAAADAQGVEVRAGDVVMVRTGYLQHWLRVNSEGGQPPHTMPGINADAGRWLADHDVVAVGADNAAVEVLPFDGGDFVHVHKILLVDSGIYLLEFLDLSKPAADEAWEGLLTVAPLKVTGATGSPVNPIYVS